MKKSDLHIRMEQEELFKLQRQASDAGMKTSEYCRRQLMKASMQSDGRLRQKVMALYCRLEREFIISGMEPSDALKEVMEDLCRCLR